MISRISFSALLKPLSKPNCAPFAVCASRNRNPSGRGPRKVCHRLTWRMTYLKGLIPLHVSELLARIRGHLGQPDDRESLVSSLTKKVARGDRFLRTDKNTFALRPEADDLAGRTAGDPVGMAAGFSPAAQLEAGHAAGVGLSRLVWAGAPCRASSGATAASSAAGAASTFCIRAVSGSRSSCLARSCGAGWQGVRGGCWGWRSMTPGCARPAG